MGFLTFVLGCILLYLLYRRVQRLEQRLRRLDRLEEDLARVELRLDHAVAVRAPEPRPAPAPPPAETRAAPEPSPPETPAAPEPAPAPPAAATPAAPATPKVAPAIDWERWIGIRGAAVLGAVALGLAGLLFFKYSIERGLITPPMRVTLGTLVGLGCLVGAEWLRGRRYRHTADAVSAAGIVILYAAFWAASVLYGLIGLSFAFALMGLVTIACCLLALRHEAFVVAVLGLVGGFATPLLLSSGADRPIGLFGYVLLLDLGLLALGRRRRWPSLAALSLVGTLILQAAWIGTRMGPGRLFLGLAILAVFAILFAVAGRSARETAEARPWVLSQIGGILFPFAFAAYFAGRVDLGPRLWPVAILLAMLAAAACLVARERATPALGAGAAAGSVAVVGVWAARHTLGESAAWELVLMSVALAGIFHVFMELDRRRETPAGAAAVALAASAAFFVLLVVAALGAVRTSPWSWVVGWLLLAALAYRHGIFPGREIARPAAAFVVGMALTLLHVSAPFRENVPPETLWLALLVGLALGAQAVRNLGRETSVRRAAETGAAVFGTVSLCGLALAAPTLAAGPLLALGGSLLLGILGAVVATRLASGPWLAAATLGTAIVHTAWALIDYHDAPLPRDPTAALVLAVLSVIVFTAWPFLVGRTFAATRIAWYAAALSGPLWFPASKRLFVDAFGRDAVGLLPLTFGAIALAAVARARRLWSEADPIRLSSLAWFAAVALGFVSVAIPLQLDREWITIGWALEGLAVIVLWKRLDHPGLKYFGIALLGAAGLRLVANPAVLGYYARSSVRIVNWLAYTYLVPAAAMVAAGALLRPLERDRLRAAEREILGAKHPVGSIASFGAAVVVVFVWINLAICDWFATGATLTLSFGDEPGQRLTLSIAWAVYALLLLGLGMRWDSLGLRWVSLGFLLVTIGKVFLYDLGALRDLYRVASLLGLAVSLILVSLLYQRFVFRGRKAESR